MIIYTKNPLTNENLEKANEACDKFIKMHIDQIQKEFEEIHASKEELIEKLEKLEKEDRKEDIGVIYDFRFTQKIQNYSDDIFHQENIFITKNEFESIDLDTYYVISFLFLT